MSLSATGGRQLSPFEPLVHAVEGAEVLDQPAAAVGGFVRSNLKGAAKDAVSGTWLGHALHPALTDVVVGSFVSAALLDLIGGPASNQASERLIQLGIALYGPTALAGASDWADAEPVDARVRRAGLAHAAVNSVALTLFMGSLRARKRGTLGRGKVLSAMGAGVLSVGGYLGGHLSFRRGIGPDQTVFDTGPEEWSAAADGAELTAGEPHRVVVDDTPVLLLRQGEQTYAIHDRCSHRGCSLSDGDVEGEEVVCACHGSRFSLRDGAVRRGPATAPQPAFETREREGKIEIRLVG
jgi:nitrite reductase/ring-hydroxylating ferredoxin subunit